MFKISRSTECLLYCRNDTALYLKKGQIYIYSYIIFNSTTLQNLRVLHQLGLTKDKKNLIPYQGWALRSFRFGTLRSFPF